MTYTARLKVFCDNKEILSSLRYSLSNTTAKQSYGGKLDSNGCTKVYNCNKLDLIFVELLLDNAKLARIRVPALENGEFNQSTFKLRTTTGTTKQAESNKVPVKVKNELEIALDSLNGTAIYFGNNFLIHDANLRAAYMREIKKMSDGYLEAVKQGKISVKDAALEATDLRNQILDATRKKNSAIGVAISQKEKAAGKTLEQILEYYAMEIKDPEKFKALRSNRVAMDQHIKSKINAKQSYFNALTADEKNRVYYSVLKGSGKSKKSFNAKIKWMKIGGRVLIVFSVAYAGYEIYNAENREKEIYRQGTTIVGGIAGGAGGGAAAGAICGPGSPICSTVGVIIGGAIGGFGAYLLVDAFDEELEAFTQWTLF
ncbi:hypothetical protein [Acinetobacter colistiniresistens]|uniref:hypothetical protein n=1 Tax=Acinetobacter colistiniresistens TaxID=280145 RepID=UPI00358FFA62